jgi:hypothetical protein
MTLPRTLSPAGLALALPIGAAIGLCLDRIHVVSGVLAYRDPVLWGQAWWVPLLFAAVAPLILVNDLLATRIVGAPAGPPAHPVDAATGWFIAAYLATGVFWRWPVALLVGLVLVWVVRTGRNVRRDRLVAALGLAIAGPLFEAALASTGTFWYVHPDVLGVPIWLAGLYLYVADFAAALGDRINAGGGASPG